MTTGRPARSRLARYVVPLGSRPRGVRASRRPLSCPEGANCCAEFFRAERIQFVHVTRISLASAVSGVVKSHLTSLQATHAGQLTAGRLCILAPSAIPFHFGTRCYPSLAGPVGFCLYRHDAATFVSLDAGKADQGWHGRSFAEIARHHGEGARHRVYWLSALGDLVVRRVGDDLKAGRRIRWNDHREALVAGTRRPAGELLKPWRDRLQGAYDQQVRIAQLMASGKTEEGIRRAAKRMEYASRLQVVIEACDATTSSREPSIA